MIPGQYQTGTIRRRFGHHIPVLNMESDRVALKRKETGIDGSRRLMPRRQSRDDLSTKGRVVAPYPVLPKRGGNADALFLQIDFDKRDCKRPISATDWRLSVPRYDLL